MEVDELPERQEKVQVSTLVHQYLEAQNLGVLAENGMQRAVTVFVDKDDRDAIKECAFCRPSVHMSDGPRVHRFYKEALQSTWDQMAKHKIAEDDLEEHMTRAKEKFAEDWEKDHAGRDQNKQRKQVRFGPTRPCGTDVGAGKGQGQGDQPVGRRAVRGVDRLWPRHVR